MVTSFERGVCERWLGAEQGAVWMYWSLEVGALLVWAAWPSGRAWPRRTGSAGHEMGAPPTQPRAAGSVGHGAEAVRVPM